MMIHGFPISYRGKQLSVLTFKHPDGTRDILSIGGLDINEVPPVMKSKAELYLQRMQEYIAPKKDTTSW